MGAQFLTYYSVHPGIPIQNSCFFFFCIKDLMTPLNGDSLFIENYKTVINELPRSKKKTIKQ